MGFYQDGFLIKTNREILNDSDKYNYIFDLYQEDIYIGTFEIKARDSKKAKKRLEIWIAYNYPEEFRFEPDYIQKKKNPFLGGRDKYIVRFNYVNNIIKDNEEEMHKYCPECGFENYSQFAKCKKCKYAFFRSY